MTWPCAPGLYAHVLTGFPWASYSAGADVLALEKDE